MAYLPYNYPVRFLPQGYISGPPLSSGAQESTAATTITGAVDTANTPAAAWTNVGNAVDGNNVTAATRAALTTASDFIDCTLAGGIPASATAIVNLSVAIRLSAVGSA